MQWKSIMKNVGVFHIPVNVATNPRLPMTIYRVVHVEISSLEIRLPQRYDTTPFIIYDNVSSGFYPRIKLLRKCCQFIFLKTVVGFNLLR